MFFDVEFKIIIFIKNSKRLEPEGRDRVEEDALIFYDEYDYDIEPLERNRRQKQSNKDVSPKRLSSSRGDLTFFGQGIGRPSTDCVCRCDCCDCCPCEEGDLIYVDK